MAEHGTKSSFIYRKRKLSEIDFDQGDEYDEPVSVPTTDQVSGNQNAGSDSHGGAIAAGVIVPLLILLIIGAIIYFWYRKKYPVRMIFGKDFGKFSNPSYEKRFSTLTLTREEPFEEAYKKDIEQFAASQEVSTQDENIDYINEQQYQPTSLSFIQRMSSSGFPGQSPELAQKQYQTTENEKTNTKSKILSKIKGSKKSLDDKNPEEEENTRQVENNMIENAEKMIAGTKKKIVPVDAGSESSETSTENQDSEQASDSGSIKQQQTSDREMSQAGEDDKDDGNKSLKKKRNIKIVVDKELDSDQDTSETTDNLENSESNIIAEDNITSDGYSDTTDKFEDTEMVDADNENGDKIANQTDTEKTNTEDTTAMQDSEQEKDNINDSSIQELSHEAEIIETCGAVEISEVQSSDAPIHSEKTLKNSENLPQDDTSKHNNEDESEIMGLQGYDIQDEKADNNGQSENKDIDMKTVFSEDTGDSVIGSQFATCSADAFNKDNFQTDPILLPTPDIRSDENTSEIIVLSSNQNVNNKTISTENSPNAEDNSVHATLSIDDEDDETDISIVKDTTLKTEDFKLPNISTSDANSLSESQFEIIEQSEYLLGTNSTSGTFEQTSKQPPFTEQIPDQAPTITSSLNLNVQNISDFKSSEQNISQSNSGGFNSSQFNSMEQQSFVHLDFNEGSGFQKESRENRVHFDSNDKNFQLNTNLDTVHFGSEEQSDSTVLFGGNEKDTFQMNSNSQTKNLYENVNVQFQENIASSSFNPYADEVDIGEAADVDLTQNITFENKDFSISEQNDVLNQDNDSIASDTSGSSYSGRLQARKEDTDSLNNFGRFGSFEMLNKEEDNDSSSIGDASLKNFSSLSSDTDKESGNMDQKDSDANKDRGENVSLDNPTFDFDTQFKLADKNGGSTTNLSGESKVNKTSFDGFPVDSPGFETLTSWIPDTDARSRVLHRRESLTVDNPFIDVDGSKTDDVDKNRFIFVDSPNSSPETGIADSGAFSKDIQQLDIKSELEKETNPDESLISLAEREVRPMKKITFNLTDINDSDAASSDDESDSDSSQEVENSYSINDDGKEDTQLDSSEA